MLKELLLICLFADLVLHLIQLVIEGPERDEFAGREPHMTESQAHLDSFQCLLDLLQAPRDLLEKATGARAALLYDPSVDLHVEADEFDVGGDASVDLPLVQLHGEVVRVFLQFVRLLQLLIGESAISVLVHRRQEQSRGVLSTLRLEHILKNAADALRALYELKTESLIRLLLLAIVEV